MSAASGLRNALKLCFVMTLAVCLPGADSPVLRVEGAAGRDGVAIPPLALTLADLSSMPHATARVRGRDGVEREYEGVLLSDVLKRAGQPLGEDLRGSLLSKYVL